MRAITGQVPDHRALAADAARMLARAWRGRAARSARAIDDLEHDLAVLKPLLDAGIRRRSEAARTTCSD